MLCVMNTGCARTSKGGDIMQGTPSATSVMEPEFAIEAEDPTEKQRTRPRPPKELPRSSPTVGASILSMIQAASNQTCGGNLTRSSSPVSLKFSRLRCERSIARPLPRANGKDGMAMNVHAMSRTLFAHDLSTIVQSPGAASQCGRHRAGRCHSARLSRCCIRRRCHQRGSASHWIAG